MLRTIKNMGKYRDWQMAILAGVLGFVITLAVMEMINAYALSLTSLSIALAAVTGSLSSICVAGSFSAWRVRQKLSEQNMRLDGALNNMVQGLCMFDAQNRLVVWNERYRTMYKSIREPSGAAAPFATCSTRASRRERFRLTRPVTIANCARRSSKATPLGSMSS